MLTLRQFIARHGITMQVQWADRNPNMEADGRTDWHRTATHYRCTLRNNQRRQMTIYFSQGPAITREPTPADVLDCVASDAASVENARSFEEWAGDLGYDPDSRKAERIWKACGKEAKKLARFLGSEEAYQALLFDTERQ